MPYKVNNFGIFNCPDCNKLTVKNSPNQKRCKPCALKAHGETKLGLSPRPCKLCNEIIYNPTSPQQYCCDKCYPIRKRKQSTIRMREYRKKKPEIFKAIHKTAYSRAYFGGIREDILKRDGYKCVSCDNENKSQLRVHHRDEHGRNVVKEQQNNNPDNLITLCASCHAKFHWWDEQFST
jgi:5-methylcytosine-specific restriction endonuclease McrA